METQITSRNLNLSGVIITSSILDEMKMFQAVDRIVEMFFEGKLPINRTSAVDKLMQGWNTATDSMSEAERQNIYRRTIGVQSDGDSRFANEEFNAIWLRFVHSVSEFTRQKYSEGRKQSIANPEVNDQNVRQAAQDLASSLSMFANSEDSTSLQILNDHVYLAIELLEIREVQESFGANDMWQVVEKVASEELGKVDKVVRYRSLAIAGKVIVDWMATNCKNFETTAGDLLDIDHERFPLPDLTWESTLKEPDDYDLVRACQLWLANGLGGQGAPVDKKVSR